LLIGGRMVRGRTVALRTTHEALSLATIAALVVHALALLGDSYMSPSLADLTIPFVPGYERVWTMTGIVAGWLLIALGLSHCARPDRARMVAPPAPVHGARLDARRRARSVRGERRRRRVVPRPRRGGRDPRVGAADLRRASSRCSTPTGATRSRSATRWRR
jgi:hypothetical protein